MAIQMWTRAWEAALRGSTRTCGTIRSLSNDICPHGFISFRVIVFWPKGSPEFVKMFPAAIRASPPLLYFGPMTILAPPQNAVCSGRVQQFANTALSQSERHWQR